MKKKPCISQLVTDEILGCIQRLRKLQDTDDLFIMPADMVDEDGSNFKGLGWVFCDKDGYDIARLKLYYGENK